MLYSLKSTEKILCENQFILFAFILATYRVVLTETFIWLLTTKQCHICCVFY